MERISEDTIRKTIVSTLVETFDAMMSMDVKAVETDLLAELNDDRMVGSINFGGEAVGVMSIHLSEPFARSVAAAMLGIEAGGIKSIDEIKDVIGELVNIVAGNLKSHFVDAGLSCVLSTPSITNGLDFKVSSTNIITPMRFLFSHDNNIIIVEVGVRLEEAPSKIKKDEEKDDQTSAAEPTDTKPDKEIEEGHFKNVDMIMEIPLQVTVELGRTKRRINDVLKMKPGSVVELDQVEGEPVDILINQTLIAKGVVVVENDKYGIRITEIVSRKERLKSMG